MRSHRLLAILGVAAFLYGRSAALARSAPSLESAASFAVLAGTSIRSEGETRITGNVGVSPGKVIAGLPPGAVRIGAIVDERSAHDAQTDAAAASARLDAMPCGATHASLEGTLAPGVHCYAAEDVHLGGTVFLDSGGDADAVWIIRIRGTLTTAPGAAVRILGGAAAGNAFWRAEEIRIGERTAFAGNMLSQTHITLGTGASLSGRALARAGEVTLDGNEISLCCVPITLATSTLPGGTVGVPYPERRFTASGGLPPYAFAATSLPPGMSLSSAGVLQGVPTTPGTFTFSIVATDAQGCPGTAVYTVAIECVPEELPGATELGAYSTVLVDGSDCVARSPLPQGLALAGCALTGTPAAPGAFALAIGSGGRTYCFTLNVAPCPIAFPPPDMPDGIACLPYMHTIETAGCVDCTITAPAALLPPGLSLSPAGVLSGTPATPGTFTFPVTARGADCARTRDVRMDVTCAVIVAPAERLPDGAVGSLYEHRLRRGACAGPHTFVPGVLPPGLSVDGDGVLRGTPSASGTYAFTVTSAAANGCPAAHSYELAVIGCGPSDVDPFLVIPDTLPNATEGEPYSETFTAFGTAPFVFRVVSGALPPGLALSTSGTLSGTPTSAGTSAFTIRVRDAAGCPVLLEFCAFDVHESSCPLGTEIALAPPALPRAIPNTPYGPIAITAAGGTPPYTFSVPPGTLPPGLTLIGGVLSGVATTSGRFTFTITAVDANGCRASRCYTLIVSNEIPTVSEWMLLVLAIVLAGAGMLVVGGRNG